MTQAALQLKRVLEQRFPDAVPVRYGTSEAVGTGVPELDALLPAGGFPRGRLTSWTTGGGATAVLRHACRLTLEGGERAAWVDAAGVTAGGFWRDEALLLRPPTPREALEGVEVLLRSGGFALVVLSGAVAGDGHLDRFTRVAREGGAALVVIAPPPLVASGEAARAAGRGSAALRISSRVSPGDYRWREGPFGPAEVESVRLEVRIRAMGLDTRSRILLPVSNDELRLSLEPGLATRRGAPSGAR